MASEGERIVKLETRMDATEGDVRDLSRQIEGPPRNESIRGRLHELETSKAAASAAEAALIVAKEVRDERQGRVWSTWQKLGVLAFSALAIVPGWVALISNISDD